MGIDLLSLDPNERVTPSHGYDHHDVASRQQLHLQTATDNDGGFAAAAAQRGAEMNHHHHHQQHQGEELDNVLDVGLIPPPPMFSCEPPSQLTPPPPPPPPIASSSSMMQQQQSAVQFGVAAAAGDPDLNSPQQELYVGISIEQQFGHSGKCI